MEVSNYTVSIFVQFDLLYLDSTTVSTTLKFEPDQTGW